MCKQWSDDSIILAGLWFGYQNPNMLTFLKPFCKSMAELHADIEKYVLMRYWKEFYMSCWCVHGTIDLPAKAMVYNMHQYNSQYGFSHCLQSGLRGSIHIYPYNDSKPNGPKRTALQTDTHSCEAFASGKPVFGVKG